MTNEEFTLRAKERAKNSSLKALRDEKAVPAVVYGHNVENQTLSVPAAEFLKVYDEAGYSTLVNLALENGSPVKVLIQDAQFHPVTDAPLHVDFFAVNLKESVDTEIPLEFTGESPAVKDLEGNLVANKNEIQVRALPTALVSELTVDISSLKTFDDVIRVKDLVIPEGIEVLDDPEDVVALVNEPRSEEELAELEADTLEAEAAAVEELGKDKETEAEGENASDTEPKDEGKEE